MYRTNATVPSEPEESKSEYINGGKLMRREQPAHVCPLPGWWARIWRRIRFGDKWVCVCGLLWEWEDWNHKIEHGFRDVNCSCIQNAWSCRKLKMRRR